MPFPRCVRKHLNTLEPHSLDSSATGKDVSLASKYLALITCLKEHVELLFQPHEVMVQNRKRTKTWNVLWSLHLALELLCAWNFVIFCYNTDAFFPPSAQLMKLELQVNATDGIKAGRGSPCQGQGGLYQARLWVYLTIWLRGTHHMLGSVLSALAVVLTYTDP